MCIQFLQIKLTSKVLFLTFLVLSTQRYDKCFEETLIFEANSTLQKKLHRRTISMQIFKPNLFPLAVQCRTHLLLSNLFVAKQRCWYRCYNL